MAHLNVSQAARTAGVSRKTIQTHIKSGKLSVARVDGEKKWIDVAELERVYGDLVAPDAVSPSEKSMHSNAREVTPLFEMKIKHLEDEVQRLHDQIRHEREEKKAVIDDLRTERDEWREQAKKHTLLLTAAQETAQEQTQKPTGGYWWWPFGRKTA